MSVEGSDRDGFDDAADLLIATHHWATYPRAIAKAMREAVAIGHSARDAEIARLTQERDTSAAVNARMSKEIERLKRIESGLTRTVELLQQKLSEAQAELRRCGELDKEHTALKALFNEFRRQYDENIAALAAERKCTAVFPILARIVGHELEPGAQITPDLCLALAEVAEQMITTAHEELAAERERKVSAEAALAADGIWRCQSCLALIGVDPFRCTICGAPRNCPPNARELPKGEE